MDAKKFKEAFEKAVDDAFDIGDAYAWEGDAGAYTKETDLTKKSIEFLVEGRSVCEHSGDEDGIRSNVRDLNGEKKTFTVDGKEYTGTIRKATVEIKMNDEDEREEDSDYTIDVTGKFILEIA